AILGWMVFSAYGVSQMPAGRASIIAFTMPLWASISAYYLLDEPFNKSKIFGLLLGLIGLGVLIGPDLLILKQAPIGALFMLGAAMSWAFGTILIKKTEWQLTPLTNVAWQLLFSAVPITGVALMLEPLPDVTQLSARASIALIYLYLFPMSFCQWAYFKVVGLLPASIAAIGTLLVPVVGVYSSYLILDEQVAATDIVALLLVMSALVMVLLVPAWRASSKRRNGHQNTKLDDVQRDR
ncbi:MAG: DMT family transporter, partial [Pseudomonadota bacterium]